MSIATREPPRTLPGVITKSRWHPPLTAFYGPPGIGKSTTAAGAPYPIVIPTEAGVENLDIARFPVATTLEEFLRNLNLVAYEKHDHKAVVIDTLNGFVDLYYRAKKDDYDFTNFGGFAGWSAVARDLAADVFEPLNECQRRDMYVVLLAHAGEYTRKNPVGDDISVAAPSIPKWVWKVIHPWLDVIGRADYVYTTRATKTDKHGRTIAKASTVEEAVNGVRVKLRRLIFDGGAEQDCKTRIGYELPAEIDLSWQAFESSLGNIKMLAEEVQGLWQYLPSDKEATTLRWLGVDSIAHLAEANRANLSQLRNRLRELKVQAPEETEEMDDPDTLNALAASASLDGGSAASDTLLGA